MESILAPVSLVTMKQRKSPAANPGIERWPVLFNQGMAALFLGRSAEAHSPLSRAVSQLSDENGWHHLGKLYVALAEMKM
ncbi:MAG TPA: hypothetical protein VKI65_04850, partial [Gemmataceae bacterium]|nr:hypothetical protein [Gemmataceae bacterium]